MRGKGAITWDILNYTKILYTVGFVLILCMCSISVKFNSLGLMFYLKVWDKVWNS